MKILWLTNIPSPYRVDFFNELGKLCDLTVLFERSSSSERDESWNNYKFESFKGIIMKGINFTADKAFTLGFIKYIKQNNYDHIVISNPLTPTGIAAMEYLKVNKIEYSIESDGAFPKEGKSFKETVKKQVLKGAKKYFSTADIHDQYYLKYGATSESIVRYPFTSLKEKDILKKPIEKTEKNKYRTMLGMKEEQIVLSVGRFIYLKGFDVLLRAAKDLSKDVGIYIVGGEITEEYTKLKNELELDNVHFIDYKNKDELSNYYKAADLFVLPTRSDAWGLVINEAMAVGLPIVTTNKCIAGLELIKNHINGFIVEADEPYELYNRMKDILENEGLMKEINNNNIYKSTVYTIERMALTHKNIFDEIIKDKNS